MNKRNNVIGALCLTGAIWAQAQSQPAVNPAPIPSDNSGVVLPSVPAASTGANTSSFPPAAAPDVRTASADKPGEKTGAIVPPVKPDVSAPQPIPATDGNTFVIGPQDVLSVTVWKEPDLSGSLPVRPDGKISMPLLHDIQAAGFTPMQLSSDIATRLKKFVQDPQVSIVVTQVNSQRIFILGEVGHPGPLAMNTDMTALQAIASAGGLSQFANKKKIYVLREHNGLPQKISFNYKQALKGDEKQNILLKPGDTIVVP